MIPMIGTIKSAVKLAELDSKWQQKKENIGKKVFQPEEQKSPEQLQIEAFQEDLKRMRESDDNAMIYNKLKNPRILLRQKVLKLKSKQCKVKRRSLKRLQKKKLTDTLTSIVLQRFIWMLKSL